VIELAIPHLARILRPRIDAVILAGGESPDPHWMDHITKKLAGITVESATHPAFGYSSECGLSAGEIHAAARGAIRDILRSAGSGDCCVWAHNLALARNPQLTGAIVAETAALGVALIAHHHDWWFDNRWRRWPELRRAGFRSPDAVARLVLPHLPNVRHVAINRADFAPLRHHFGKAAHWLPNPIETPSRIPSSRLKKTRSWLRAKLGENAPVWLLPCRVLRRKNIAEALLLTRWLRPGAWLVTTAGASSADELDYAATLSDAAEKYGLRLRLGILRGDGSEMPTVPELLAASEAVILTSIQEGFGLPFLEAAAAGRPLIARRLPNVFPDLAKFGFRFPQSYDEILIHPDLFDWDEELRRQGESFRVWRGGLPRTCRKWAGKPIVISAGRCPVPIPFSRLSLAAQIGVIARSPESSWELCAPLNPFLIPWRKAASTGELRPTPQPSGVDHWLSGDAYARHFQKIVRSPSPPPHTPCTSEKAQDEFLRDRLASHNLFPLLWAER